jgi:putative ABC transport system ATP-binding protein
MTHGAALVVEHVSKAFGGRIRALDDVSLALEPGELVLLSGPSGSGKSTLLNLVAGLDRPDAGRILVGGREVGALRDPARYRREVVGFVFQLHHLILGLTAEENVEAPLIPTRLRHAERIARARAALEEVGLAQRRTHLPAQLSGGERQRVAVARALVGRPRLLLADEPTGALDSHSGKDVMRVLLDLNETGTTIVVITHERVVASHLPRQVSMLDGQVIDDRIAAAP